MKAMTSVCAVPVVVVLAVGAVVSPASAQRVRYGALSGTVVSKSASVPVGPPVTLYTTPTDVFFVLTEVCSRSPAGGGHLRATGFGEIVVPLPMGEATCAKLSPGVALPQGSVLTFTAEFEAAQVMITGVLTK